jgi:hypothetical protein
LLKGKDSSVAFGLEVNAGGQAKAAASTSWWHSQKESVWRIAPALEEPATGLVASITGMFSTPKPPEDGVKLFMTGWYWRPKRFRRTPDPTDKQKKQSKFLGAGDGQSIQYVFPGSDEQETVVELKLEKVGTFKTDS